MGGKSGGRCCRGKWRRFVVVGALAVSLCGVAAGTTDRAAAVGGVEEHEVRLALMPDGRVDVRYKLARAVRSLTLGIPQGSATHWQAAAPTDAVAGPEGELIVPVPERTFRLILDARGDKSQRPAQYPLTFAVAGRGTAVFVPFLLPQLAGSDTPVSILLQGGEGVAAVADGQYRKIPSEYEMARHDGFVLLGRTWLRTRSSRFRRICRTG